LLITALLVALCAEFTDEVFVDTSARQNFVDGQQASLLAASGIEAATKLLQFGQSIQGYSSLADLDRLNKLLHIEDEQGTIQVTVEDESAKLNLNQAWGNNGTGITPYSDNATRLFKNCGLSIDLLDAFADWRDTDDDPHPAGAETPYYSTLKPPYAAKNNKLSTFEELRIVKGFDAATVNRLRPVVTIYDDCTQININTAPKEVIMALSSDMTNALAENVIDYRKTNPFKTVSDLGNVPGIMGSMVLSLQGFTSVKGTVFRIHSEARVNETTRIVEAVVKTGGQFLYWREY
jgi:general secretion pathway protein K